MNAVEEVPAPSRWSWVSCPNPFYLLSAACVLHSFLLVAAGTRLGDAAADRALAGGRVHAGAGADDVASRAPVEGLG